MHDSGWIPPFERTKEQNRHVAEFHERIGHFGVVGSTVSSSDLPERVIFPELELKHNGGKLLPRVHQQSGSCLVEGTIVQMANGNPKAIEDIKLGDEVISHVGVPRKVIYTSKHPTTEDVLQLSSGSMGLYCTENHVIPVKRQDNQEITWKKAKEIDDGDFLLAFAHHSAWEGFEGTPVPASVRNNGPTKKFVYDIGVEEDHSFIANNFSVHNCVGAGAAIAYVFAMLCDKIYRSDTEEEVKPVFPWATYGIGRRKGGLTRSREGSFGSVQAWAVDPDNFGYLPWDYPGLPKPTIKGNWWSWSERVEKQWALPRSWPINERELAPEAGKYGILGITQIRSVDQLIEAFAQGYTGTVASMFGTSARVEGDVLIGRRNRSWAHQMEIGPSYWFHPEHGLIAFVQNQWSDVAHPRCPLMSKYGVGGGFWVKRDTLEYMVRTGEVYVHSNTGNFPSRNPKKLWDNLINWV